MSIKDFPVILDALCFVFLVFWTLPSVRAYRMVKANKRTPVREKVCVRRQSKAIDAVFVVDDFLAPTLTLHIDAQKFEELLDSWRSSDFQVCKKK
ncbi:MAG: hypothetical protein ACREHG_03465 [Candidatus Saccharimonadales bacterium]